MAYQSNFLIKQSNWWEVSDIEKQELLNKEFDFGNGIKFKNKDIPDLAKQVNIPAGPKEHHPELNQLKHNNLVYDSARKLSNDPMVWFGAVMHDLGKVYTDEKLLPKHHGHELAGVQPVSLVSDMLNVPKEWKDFAKAVAEHHLTCHNAKKLNPKTIRKLFKLFNSNKDLFTSYITSCEADAKGRLGFEDFPYEQKDFLLKSIDEDIVEKKSSNLAVSGNDLMKEFNLTQGPEIGNAIKYLKEIIEINPSLNDKKTLLDIFKKHYGKK